MAVAPIFLPQKAVEEFFQQLSQLVNTLPASSKKKSGSLLDSSFLNQKINKLKLTLSKKHCLNRIPTNFDLLLSAPQNFLPLAQKYLLSKPTRTLSGVAPLALMTPPFPCPHGQCLYCPGGPKSFFGDVPQSYTGQEPATLRGIRNFYDPFLQIFNRLEQYLCLGHFPEKIELIIMGGTFPSLSKKFQTNFILESFLALNAFSHLFYPQGKFNLQKFKHFFLLPTPSIKSSVNQERVKKIQSKILKLKDQALTKSKIKLKPSKPSSLFQLKKALFQAHKKNESSHIKCIGLTVETRPDFARLTQANFLLDLGSTKVELGVQSVYPEILKIINRKHTLQDIISSTRTLKDLGFKINYHLMPGLPDKNYQRISVSKDLQGLKTIFNNPDFRPDMLKIYPCLVLKGTPLYKKFKQGLFQPLSTHEATKLISRFKTIIPEYCRVMRVQRDISSKKIEAGVNVTNLRQYIHSYMKKHSWECSCIRCREIKTLDFPQSKITSQVQQYSASQGQEFFISANYRPHLKEQGYLLGFCRLRFPSQFLRKEITNASALIRELHVYGSLVPISQKKKTKSKTSHPIQTQHRGIGKSLLKLAEKISKQHHKNKLLVISGVGVRNYYRKLGFKKQGPYLVKQI